METTSTVTGIMVTAALAGAVAIAATFAALTNSGANPPSVKDAIHLDTSANALP
jgi:hypothetical protein